MAITGISYQAQHNLNSGNTTPHGAAYIPSLPQVWIANNSDDDIYKYNESFAYQGKTSLPSGFAQPRGLCWVASRSELWGVDTGQNRIYRMNTTLASQGTYDLTSGNSNPEGILSFDSIGEVWVVNNTPQRVYRYNASDGSFIAYFALDSQIGDPRGGAYQPEADEAWILDQTDKIGRYNAARAFQGVYSLNSVHTFPRACVTAGSLFWVIDNGIDKAVSYNILTDAVAISQPVTQKWTQNTAIATTTLPAATGGNGSYTYTLTGLPSGLSFDATTRELSGTPTDNGDFTLTYTASDSWGKSASRNISIKIKSDNDITIINDLSSLLPPNATDWEKSIEKVFRASPFGENQAKAVLAAAFNPQECPVSLLPYLALNRSIELDLSLGVTEKRNLLSKAFALHVHDGTIQVIEDIITALGYTNVSVEETAPAAYDAPPSAPVDPSATPADQTWATYSIELNESVLNTPAHPDALKIATLLNKVVPLRSKLIEIRYTGVGSYTFDVDFSPIDAGTYTQVLEGTAPAAGQFRLRNSATTFEVYPASGKSDLFSTHWKPNRLWEIGSWEFTLVSTSESGGVYSATFTTTAGTALTNAARTGQVLTTSIAWAGDLTLQHTAPFTPSP